MSAAERLDESLPEPGLDPVLACLSFLARRFDRPSSTVVLSAGLALSETGRLPFHQVEASLEQVGMRAEPVGRSLARLARGPLPVVIELEGEGAALILEAKGGQVLAFDVDHDEAYWTQPSKFAGAYTGSAVLVEPDPDRERENERPWAHAARTHWFWSEIWKVRRAFFPVAVAALIVNLLGFASPLFTMNVYDRILPNQAQESLWGLAIGVALAFSLELALRLARASLVDEVGREVDAKLSQKLFEKVMNIPLTAKSGSTGALAKRISEYEIVRDFFASTTVVLAVDMVFMVLFLVLILFLAPLLIFVPLVGIVFMFFAGLSLQKGMAKASKDAQADAGLQHAVLVETIGGIETLKATRAEGRMLGRWRRYSDMAAVTQERLRRYTSRSSNLASFTQQFISLGLLVGGFYLHAQNMITMGGIIAIIMISSRALSPVGQFALLMTRFRQAIVTMNSLQTLMEQPDEREAGVRSVSPEVSNGQIRMEHVAFKYPGADVASLADASITISPGERIGVIGRVASGKSTFGRLLCGLYPPTEGAILVDGIDSRQYHAHELRSAFRFIGQDAELFNGTVRDNLLLGGPMATDQDLIDAVKKSGADMFLARDSAGFDLTVGERGSRLSGGQRSFLVLARALVQPCKLLFLDEPTGAMDTQTERYFIEKLNTALTKDQTLVVSTHRHAMLNIVTRLVVIDGGRIIADGPRDKVLGALAENLKSQ